MNPNTLIVVADSARARLFQIETTDHPRAPVRLREMESLVHPDARSKEGDHYAGSFPAAVGNSATGQGHTLNDHRGAHEAENLRRFARDVAQSVARVVKEQASVPVLVVATHALHAVLGSELVRALPRDAKVQSEIAELSELTPSELLGELEHRRLLQP
jgi:protein required for attachment to host cells